MKTYKVTLTGVTPMIQNHDDIAWADAMTEWQMNPANKDKSKAGDDRTPPYRWFGCLYRDHLNIALPSDNVMAVIKEAAAMVKSGARSSFKAQSQSGMLAPEPFWQFFVNGQQITWEQFDHSKEQRSLSEFQELVQGQGFRLLIKRAKVGQSKHIRVRPLFDNWSAVGSLVVMDEALTKPVLETILFYAGSRKGLGDWRPGAPKSPGPYGTFTATVEAI